MDELLSTRPHTAAYLAQMEQCAAHLGWVSQKHLVTRLVEADAELVMRGIDAAILRARGNYLHTLDPRQATAWLVEGAPAHLCWEYAPHAAAYVELIDDLGLPPGSVRFETPESEAGMSLDLAVVERVPQLLRGDRNSIVTPRLPKPTPK